LLDSLLQEIPQVALEWAYAAHAVKEQVLIPSYRFQAQGIV